MIRMNNSSLSTSRWVSSINGIAAWCTAFGVTNFAILVFNLLALYAFYANRAKMLNMRANYFILNLCCADLMVGCVSLPLYLHTLIEWLRHKQQRWHTSVYIYMSVDIFSGFASVFTLVVIALERVYAIYCPLRHKLCRAKLYFSLLATVWFLSLLMAVLYFFDQLKIVSFDVFFYTTSICLLLSFVVAIAAHVAIWVRTVLRNWHKGKTDVRNVKLAQTLTIITVVFGLTWLPFQIINTAYWVCAKLDKSRNCLPDFSLVCLCKLLQYANSFANPIIYSFRIPEFKNTLLSLVKEKRREQTNNVELCRSPDLTISRLSRLSRKSARYFMAKNFNERFQPIKKI